MKKMKIALTLALLPVFIHADGQYEMHDTTTQTPPSFIEYHNRMAVFGPLHQVYERTKTDAFYAGVEAWVLGSNSSKGFATLAEAEFRLGYNYFYNGRDHVTPFVGGGIFKDFESHHYNTTITYDRLGFQHHHKHRASLPAVAYGVLGFLYDHEFNTVVNLGANLKGIVGGAVSKKHIDWGSPVVGFDVAIPLTFRFGYKRHWDFRIEPFDIFLHGKNLNINFFGLRSTIGYRF